MNDIQIKIASEYIEKINREIAEYNSGLGESDSIFDLLAEIVNVYDKEICQIKSSVLFRHGTELRDANTVKALLKMHLASAGVEYEESEQEEIANIKCFWTAFILWFEKELVSMKLLRGQYLHWDNWAGGTWYLNIDFDYEYKLHKGIEYPETLKKNTGNFEDIKDFLELAYRHWIINDGKSHYAFTIEVNERFSIFKLPYRMQNGVIIKQGYKTTYGIDKIIDYHMFERKIRFSETMITNHDLMEKKSALDFLIDALQYMVSIQNGTRDKQYAALANSVSGDQNSKVYAVVKQELNELMKLSNEYFDIRHNDYLNGAKEKREALNDSQFVEYLYNRAYALLYLLRLKKNQEEKQCFSEKNML